MTDLTYPKTGRMSASDLLNGVLSVVACVMPSALVGAANDRYLGMLGQEMTKVESAATDKQASGDVTPFGATAGDGAEEASSREHFEQMLRKKHAGTYSFYRRLPQHSREEVLVDYRAGAPVAVLGGKIIDRFLHP